eukprot:scaffold65050_cov42-Attheya_sp.AAC.1
MVIAIIPYMGIVIIVVVVVGRRGEEVIGHALGGGGDNGGGGGADSLLRFGVGVGEVGVGDLGLDLEDAVNVNDITGDNGISLAQQLNGHARFAHQGTTDIGVIGRQQKGPQDILTPQNGRRRMLGHGRRPPYRRHIPRLQPPQLQNTPLRRLFHPYYPSSIIHNR